MGWVQHCGGRKKKQWVKRRWGIEQPYGTPGCCLGSKPPMGIHAETKGWGSWRLGNCCKGHNHHHNFPKGRVWACLMPPCWAVQPTISKGGRSNNKGHGWDQSRTSNPPTNGLGNTGLGWGAGLAGGGEARWGLLGLLRWGWEGKPWGKGGRQGSGAALPVLGWVWGMPSG